MELKQIQDYLRSSLRLEKIIAFNTLICLCIVNLERFQLFENKLIEKETHNFFDGCYHVYLDVGTNVGIQVRNLLS